MTFDFTSYKAGFLAAATLACLRYSFNRWKRGNAFSLLPFLVQLFWAATIITWEIYWFYLATPDGSITMEILVTVTLNIALDTVTKLLLLYYVCYRLIVLLKISSPMDLVLWYSAIGICAIVVVFAELMFLLPSYDPKVFSQATGNILYMLADVAISIAELTVIFKYVIHKFQCKSISEIYNRISDCGLLESFVVTILMALLSAILLGIISIIDPDWHFYYICSAIRYSVSCKLALVFVEKTISYGSKKNDESMADRKRPQHMSTNLDRPVGPYSFAVNAL
jgi:hypothetical protein